MGGLIYAICIQLSYDSGFGRHYEYLTIPLGLNLLKWIYIAQAFALIVAMVGRISFTLYLLAIIGKSGHRLKGALWTIICLQAAFNVALVVTLYVVCGTDMTVIFTYGTRKRVTGGQALTAGTS